MNHKVMSRPYTAPQAEIVLFAPADPIASWKINGSSSDTNWNRHWGVDWNTLNTASITGGLQWYDDTTNQKNYELD